MVGIYVGISLYDTMQAQFFTDWNLPAISRIIQWWDWKMWLVVGMGIALGAALEWFYRYTKRIEAERQRIVKEELQERLDRLDRLDRLAKLRRDIRGLDFVIIPGILQGMHKRLRFLTESKAKDYDDDKLGKCSEDLLEAIGVKKPKLPKPDSKMSEEQKMGLGKKLAFKWLRMFTKHFNRKVHSEKQIMDFLTTLGTTMDDSGVGLSQISDADKKYMSLRKQLEKLRIKVSSDELNKTIDSYLDCSYGLNSLYLLSLYALADRVKQLLPTKISTGIMSLPRKLDVAMNQLLVKVAKATEKYLLGDGLQ